MALHGIENRGERVPAGVPGAQGRFGRLFPFLPALPHQSRPAPAELGKIIEHRSSDPQPNPRIPAGFTYLGQFIDHDITFDATSVLEQQNDPRAVWNFRTPYLELDSVYGAGPRAAPQLYDRRAFGKLLLDELSPFDLPRNSQDTALIGDPRNDENLIVSQLHLAFVKFHNRVLDEVGELEEAQRVVRWHYQWIVLHEFLRKVCREDVVDDVLANGRRSFLFDGRDEAEPFIPVEFSVAAYRFGHSMVRGAYAINRGLRGVPLFGQPGGDLRGGREVGWDRAVDWSRFFTFTGKERPQASLRIDTQIALPLLHLPDEVIPIDATPPVRSLAVRNLQRSLDRGLPSGQSVAGFLREEVLADDELWDGTSVGRAQAPLWFYVLREAEVREDGERLGRVGSRLVAEVIIGLLQGDRRSFLFSQPDWKPFLPRHDRAPRGEGVPDAERFTMADLLHYARAGRTE